MMLRVTIELVPSSGGKPEQLAVALIGNDGTGTPGLGNYRVWLSKRGKPRQLWKRGTVEEFPRQRLGPWDLLYRCLDATVGKRR